MITVKLMGGLGNQMFQYALGKHLAIKNNCTLKFDINFLKYKGDAYKDNFTNREFQLDQFNIANSLLTRKPFLTKKFNFIAFRRKKLIKVIESDISFNPEILKLNGDLYLDGYWQSERYFKDIEQIIRKEFTFITPLSRENKKVADLIIEKNSVSLHIRRGDYVSNTIFLKVLGTCSLSYYLKTVELIRSEISNPFFFVFSDDILWAKQNLGFIDSNILFLDFNNEKNCHEDLRLMSLCKHNIIANSSFSWWGAWLNNNKSKLVIAPEKWFNDDSFVNKDLIPESWIKL